MRQRIEREPERRWWRRWESAYRRSGGFAGTATLGVQREHALRYFRAGATAEAAGMMCAEQYQLHSSRETDREWGQGMREDIQEALQTGSLEALRQIYGARAVA